MGYKIWRNTQYLNLHRIYTNPSSSFKLCFQNRESLFLAGEILTSGVLPIPCIFENLWWNFHSDKHHLKNCDHKSTLNNNIEDMFACIWKQMTFPKRCPDRKEIENPGLPKRKRSPKKNPDYFIWFTVNGKRKSALDLTTRIGPWQTNNIYVSQLFTLLQ